MSLNPPQHTQKEVARKRNFAFRLNAFFFIIFLLFSVLIVRLAFLQFVQSKEIIQMENETQYQKVPIAPIRGRIYDRDGYPIAITTSEQSLFFRVEPGQKTEEMIQEAEDLAGVFRARGAMGSDMPDAKGILKLMDAGIDIDGNSVVVRNYNWMPRRIKANLSHDEIAYIEAHGEQFPGMEISEESVRQYDKQQIAVQLVGYLRPFSAAINLVDSYTNDDQTQYINDEYVGLDGLELMYQDELRGQNGYKTYPVDKLGRIIGQVQVQPPVKGKNLYLTIQKDVQTDTQKAIAEQLTNINEQADKGVYPFTGHHPVAGYAVAMEVQTGRVVAMASIPDYDPNVWRGGLTNDEYQKIMVKSANGAIRERYADLPDPDRSEQPTSLVPPGSTLKPLTVLLGLNEGLITPNEIYHDTGCFYFGKDNSHVCNSDQESFGNINAADAIAFSANTYMAAMVGNRLYMSSKIQDPIDLWDSYMKQFGLGVTTGSGLPGESNGVIMYFEDAKRYQAQSPLVLGSFGQEGRYTTLQLAQYASTLANHGKRMKPLFVDHITDYDNQAVEQVQPQVLNTISFPDNYWDVIESGMSRVFVTGFDGTSRDAYVTGKDGTKYPVLRKTGTSQSNVAGQIVENGVFIAYAPADHPKLAVAVVIPNGGYGSWSAAPIARKIFDSYEQHVGLGN